MTNEQFKETKHEIVRLISNLVDAKAHLGAKEISVIRLTTIEAIAKHDDKINLSSVRNDIQEAEMDIRDLREKVNRIEDRIRERIEVIRLHYRPYNKKEKSETDIKQ